MPVQIASWADFGYRKLGPLPASGGGLSTAQVAEVIGRIGDYEVRPNYWVRRQARKKLSRFNESIQFVDVLQRDTALDDGRLSFFEDHAISRWTAVE